MTPRIERAKRGRGYQWVLIVDEAGMGYRYNRAKGEFGKLVKIPADSIHPESATPPDDVLAAAASDAPPDPLREAAEAPPAGSTEIVLSAASQEPERAIPSGVSGSGVAHVVNCPGSRHLKKADHVNRGNRRGKEFHDWLADVNKRGHSQALKALPDGPVKKRAEGFDNVALGELLGDGRSGAARDGLLIEAAFAWDWATDTSRLIGHGLERNYGKLGPTEIPVTLDFAIVQDEPDAPSSRGYIAEIKTGATEVPPPDYNWQIKIQALALARHYKLEWVRAGLVHVADDGSADPLNAEWDGMDLDGFAAEIAATMARSGLVTGDHCKWCDSFPYCEVQARTATAIVEVDCDALTPEIVATVWPKYQAVKKAVDKVKKAIASYVEINGPVALENGKQLKLRSDPFSTIKADIAVDVLRQSGDIHTAQYLTAGLGKSIEFCAERAGLDVGEVMDEIKRRGGVITRQKNPSLREVKK